MSALNIITVIAVILFARLGVRLYFRYRKMKNEKDKKSQSE
jgi:hypothetical protein